MRLINQNEMSGLATILFKVIATVFGMNVTLFEKAIQCSTLREAEQLAQFGLGEPASPVLLDSERLQRATREIAAAGA